MAYKTGALVKLRDRDWIVMDTNDPELLYVKPLDGTDDEMTCIYLPLNSHFKNDEPKSTEFIKITHDDIGTSFELKTLYDALRLSFRNSSGAFRSWAKLSFTPRNYQVIPLVMALKQKENVRLLIADDVGVGKTLEALMIVKELLERKKIKRFAVITLPHLCDQWQKEIEEKFGIKAVVIRSNTQAKLDREIQGDISVFEYYPYQVISIDYMKSENRRTVFIQECPEMVIVDEAHSCVQGNDNLLHKRYELIKQLSIRKTRDGKDRNLILLTATPHSGKEEDFASLLGLIKPELQALASSISDNSKELAKYFVQRRRDDIKKDDSINFPERIQDEIEYKLSDEYIEFYDKMVDFALGVASREGNSNKKGQKLRYWAALALLRGVMSSPLTALSMLETRIEKRSSQDLEQTNNVEEEIDIPNDNPVIENSYDNNSDFIPVDVIEGADWTSVEVRKLRELAKNLKEISGIELDNDNKMDIQKLKIDNKINKCIDIVKKLIKDGYNPIIFCRYINTAEYVGQILSQELKSFNKVQIEVLTSDKPDESRKVVINSINENNPRVLVATDCLSEGINLQDKFNAVIHYDLPWNPNRLEQREGRIDRFGQNSEKVKATILYSKDNFIDGIILGVLIHKVKQIKNELGISLPFPEENKAIIDSVLNAWLTKAKKRRMEADNSNLLTLFDISGYDIAKEQMKQKLVNNLDDAKNKALELKNIFSQQSIKIKDIAEDFKEANELIGSPQDVENFVITCMENYLGLNVEKVKSKTHDGLYKISTINLKKIPSLSAYLPNSRELKICFQSPYPEGYYYIGRNHIFVEQLCQYILSQSFLKDKSRNSPSRVSVIKTSDVKEKHVIFIFRVRNVIKEIENDKQLISEEVILSGYKEINSEKVFLTHNEAKSIIENVKPTINLDGEQKEYFFDLVNKKYDSLKEKLDEVALERATNLVQANERYTKLVSGSKYSVVTPVLPMDLIAVYVILSSESK